MQELEEMVRSASGVRQILDNYSLHRWEALNMEAQVQAGGGGTSAGATGPQFSEMDDKP